MYKNHQTLNQIRSYQELIHLTYFQFYTKKKPISSFPLPEHLVDSNKKHIPKLSPLNRETFIMNEF